MHASALSALGNGPISATGLAEQKGGRHKGFHYTNVYKQRGYIYICMCKCFSIYIYHFALLFTETVQGGLLVLVGFFSHL